MARGEFHIPEQALEYTQALRALAHVGIAAWYPSPNNPLLRFPVEAAGVLDRAGVAQHRAAFKESLERIVDERVEGDFRERLQALYGLRHWEGEPLLERQRFIGQNYPSSGRDWQGFRKEPFDRHLLSTFICLENEKFASEGQSIVEAVSALGYEVVQYFSRYNIATGETVQHRLVRALRDEVLYWEASTLSFGRADESISLVGPGTLTIHDKGDARHAKSGKSSILRVDFPKALKRGKEFRFTLLRSEAPELDRATNPGYRAERHLIPRLPVRRATIEIEFPPDRQPTEVWAFQEMASWLAPGLASAGIPLGIKENVARFSWPNPRVSRACGIGWEW